MFLASRIQWYTCVAGPYCAASCIHSQCAPGSGKKKCTTTEGSLRTYCPINLLWVYNYDIHCKSPLLCTCLEALQVYQTGHTNYVCSMHVSSVRKSRVYIHQSCPTIEEAAIPPITMSLIKKSHLQPQPPLVIDHGGRMHDKKMARRSRSIIHNYGIRFKPQPIGGQLRRARGLPAVRRC